MNIHAYVIMYILFFLINDNDWEVNLVLWSHTIYHVLSSPKTKANIKINLHKHLYTRLQGTRLFIFCYSFESFCSEFSSFIPPLRYDTAFTHLATLPNVRVRMEFRFLSTKGENPSAFKSLTLLREKWVVFFYTLSSVFLKQIHEVDIC